MWCIVNPFLFWLLKSHLWQVFLSLNKMLALITRHLFSGIVDGLSFILNPKDTKSPIPVPLSRRKVFLILGCLCPYLVLKMYQDRWPFLLIDEYQDTNFSQYTIAKLSSFASK